MCTEQIYTVATRKDKILILLLQGIVLGIIAKTPYNCNKVHVEKEVNTLTNLPETSI